MKFSGTIATEFSGSLGGLTASRNRAGQYFKAKSTPVNPNTSRQSLARTIVQQLSTRWTDNLVQAERDAWDNYALNTPGFSGTGINQYIRSNLARQVYRSIFALTLPIIDAAPPVFGVGGFSPIAVGGSEATGLTFVFNNTDDWANEDDSFLMVFMTGPQNGSRQARAGSYILVNAIAGDSVTPPTSPTVLAPVVTTLEDQAMYVKVVASVADGRYSYGQEIRVLFGA